MLSWVALLCLAGGVILLFSLSVTDIRTRLLPNEMVLGLATLAVVFHLTTFNSFMSFQAMLAGGIIGFSTLYLLRAAANKIYDTDALGLGDVKLLGAAGFWLGADGVMLAMAVGAMAALVHGFIYALYFQKKTGAKRPDFINLKIPAGPGFAIGILIAGAVELSGFRVTLG